jgi:hypothetical protein
MIVRDNDLLPHEARSTKHDKESFVCEDVAASKLKFCCCTVLLRSGVACFVSATKPSEKGLSSRRVRPAAAAANHRLRLGTWRFLQSPFGFGNIYMSMRRTPMRYTPMSCTPHKVHTHEVYVREMHAYEVHAHEVYLHEMHARKMHAREVHAHETHAYEIHAREMHAHEMHAREVHAYKMHAREMHAREVHAYKMHVHEIHGAR